MYSKLHSYTANAVDVDEKATEILDAVVTADKMSQLIMDSLSELMLKMIDSMFEFKLFYGDINKL
ncbi:MAG: hypothetical protein AB8B46_00470 [Candidatus Midichloriaceae bacterium]